MWRRWVCLARYEANGNVAAIEDANGVVTKASYNAIGQRTGVNDPNQGSWGFAYNALGEVLAQSDARGIATTLSYDKLGRPTTRNATVDVTGDSVADAVADSWNYDPANAKGALLSDQRTINGQLERTTTQTYDALARPVQIDVAQQLNPGINNYRMRTKYDSYYGRPLGQEYPNGEAVQVLYSVYGHAVAEKDPGTGIEYRRSNSVNARGQATQETFGNGVILTPTYQLQTGQLTGLTYSGASGNLRTLGYGYDVFGNVKRQSLNGGASREDYSYDQLHRMVQSIRSGAASGTVNYGYDAVGNIAKKSDFSSNTANAYSYTSGSCGGGANAVKSVALAAGGTRTYCYDANGNLTGDNAGLSLKYDHQNLPVVAQRGALRDDFRYGADGMRTRSWGSDGNRVYLPGYEHRTDTGETKVYIGDYAVISTTGATRKVEYLLKDRLGSVDAVANASGSVIETRGYDAFGKPRNGTWNDLSPAKIASTAVTPKGFTQHEHLNQLELIHMNGRAYDYNLGRFTGVDPFIQFPLNSQSLNPYSYILNNPLSGTDPTGYACSTGTHIAGGNGPDCGVTNVSNNAPMKFAPDKVPSASGGNGATSHQASACGGPRNTSQNADGNNGLASAVTRDNVDNDGNGDDSAIDGLGKSGWDIFAGTINLLNTVVAPVVNGVGYAIDPSMTPFDSFGDAVTHQGSGIPSYGGSDTPAGDAGYRSGQVLAIFSPELLGYLRSISAAGRVAELETLTVTGLRSSEAGRGTADAARSPTKNANGGVDFSGHADLYPTQNGQQNVVRIEYTGSRRQDFGAANQAGGIGTTQKPPSGYTWHHLDDYDPSTNSGTMQLVKREAHEATYPHNGGVRQYEQATGSKYK